MIPAIGGPYELARYGAALASPAFTGTPTAPTPAFGDESTQLATAAFVARMQSVNSVVLAADADTVLTKAQLGAVFINIFGFTSVTRTITLPGGQQKQWIINNQTSNGQAISVKITGAATILIPNGEAVHVRSDGTSIFGVATMHAVDRMRVGDGVRNAVIFTPGATAAAAAQLGSAAAPGIQVTARLGFNSATPLAKPAVTGSRGANAALASLLTQLALYGLITDSTVV